jgi:ribosomal protein L11 methyltransferase
MPRHDQFAPFEIGRRFRILPPDGAAGADDRLTLFLHRGAFGSGEHETTASCLERLERLDQVEGARVLDVGSGTGILALAALRLGAASATCVDVSAEAIAVGRENARLNRLADRVRHVVGSVDAVADRDFTLVLANLYGDLLIAVAPDLVARARPGAHLLLSGMLWEYEFDVRQTYARLGCRLVDRRMLTEYSTALLIRE